MSFCKIQTLLTFGAEEKAEETVTTAPDIPDTDLLSTLPSDKTTDNVGLFVASKSVAAVSSTVIAVVVAAFILPPLLLPALTGSLISITCPGLTTTPSYKPVAKLTVSVEFCSSNKINLPILLA